MRLRYSSANNPMATAAMMRSTRPEMTPGSVSFGGAVSAASPKAITPKLGALGGTVGGCGPIAIDPSVGMSGDTGGTVGSGRGGG